VPGLPLTWRGWLGVGPHLGHGAISTESASACNP
jgi:hypothetical protein